MALSTEELAVLTERLSLYYAAEAAILRNQSYDMPDGRSLTRTSLADVRAEIKAIRAEIAGGSATAPVARGRVRRGVIFG